MICASAPGVRSVVQLTSVVDFRFAIEAIAALSQLTDREFHTVVIRNNCDAFAKRQVAICEDWQHFRRRAVGQ